MAGRTPSAAVAAFVEPLQAALGCFADGKVTADSRRPGEQGVLTFNRSEPVLLGSSITIEVALRYRVVKAAKDIVRGPYKVSTEAYMYDLRRQGQKVVEYHWHPMANYVRPHLHRAEILKGHVPTGRVMVEDVLCLAVELGVQPRDLSRWAELDRQNREGFSKGATWGRGPRS